MSTNNFVIQYPAGSELAANDYQMAELEAVVAMPTSESAGQESDALFHASMLGIVAVGVSGMVFLKNRKS